MKKILTVIILTVLAIGFFGSGSVSAAEITKESDCKKVGGSWISNGSGGNICVSTDISTQQACTDAKGLWRMVNSSGNYTSYCVIRVDDDGKTITEVPGSSTSYSNAECNILPDSICNAKDEKELGESSVWKIVEFVLQILTVGVGIVALAGVVYGSALYASAGGNPEQVKKARTIILNVVIGVVAYALMYALLQWLIPGGVFG